MSTETYEAALDRAAFTCGVEPRFWDMAGHERVASPQARVAIVQALGIDATSTESIDAALSERERKEWMRILAPCYVCTLSREKMVISLKLPRQNLHNFAQLRTTLESGRELITTHDLSGLHVEEEKQFDMPWVRLNVSMEADLPLGYHRLEIQVGDKRASAALIVAPPAAWQPEFLKEGGKTSGFNVALYGLRSARNWGFGDFTDLNALSTWAARDLGISFIGLNPLHAIHNRRPYNTSPYLPNTTFFQNCLYLDIESIEEWTISRRAQACFHTAATQREVNLLRESPEVEYERVSDIKTRFLKLLFLEFLRRNWCKGTARARAFQAYRDDAGDLLTRFALYCAIDAHLRRTNPNLWIWTEWPRQYQEPESPETRAFARKHWRAVLFYEYAAWQTANATGSRAKARRGGWP